MVQIEPAVWDRTAARARAEVPDDLVEGGSRDGHETRSDLISGVTVTLQYYTHCFLNVDSSSALLGALSQ